MKLQAERILPLALSVVLLTGCASDTIQDIEAGYNKEAGAGPMAMAHIGHVATAWAKAPKQAGLLATARMEAQIAQRHADLALQRVEDSDWVKMHTHHIKHALVPTGSGAGTGYGLIRALQDVKTHSLLAAEQRDASDAVKFHAEQIAMSADSALARAEALNRLTDRIMALPRHRDLSQEAQQMADLASKILTGADLNQDGDISWQDNEPGLDQALRYLDFLLQKENP